MRRVRVEPEAGLDPIQHVVPLPDERVARQPGHLRALLAGRPGVPDEVWRALDPEAVRAGDLDGRDVTPNSTTSFSIRSRSSEPWIRWTSSPMPVSSSSGSSSRPRSTSRDDLAGCGSSTPRPARRARTARRPRPSRAARARRAPAGWPARSAGTDAVGSVGTVVIAQPGYQEHRGGGQQDDRDSGEHERPGDVHRRGDRHRGACPGCGGMAPRRSGVGGNSISSARSSSAASSLIRHRATPLGRRRGLREPAARRRESRLDRAARHAAPARRSPPPGGRGSSEPRSPADHRARGR